MWSVAPIEIAPNLIFSPLSQQDIPQLQQFSSYLIQQSADVPAFLHEENLSQIYQKSEFMRTRDAGCFWILKQLNPDDSTEFSICAFVAFFEHNPQGQRCFARVLFDQNMACEPLVKGLEQLYQYAAKYWNLVQLEMQHMQPVPKKYQQLLDQTGFEQRAVLRGFQADSSGSFRDMAHFSRLFIDIDLPKGV